MSDEIDTAAQLVELAMLREVVIHELVANRGTAPDAHGADLPPEELHAPDSPDDDAAMRFYTRLEGTRLGVRCRIETSNAYGNFVVDAETIFELPAPVSPRHPDIVDEFTEQVGAPTVFPYLRAAVASLAAQLSVPASPLPLLRVGDVTHTHDDELVADEEPSEPFVCGTVTRTTDVGQEHVAEFFIDEQTGTVSRFGGEGETEELDKLLNAWAELPPPHEISWEWTIRRSGEAAIRQSIEAAREAEGNDATDLALAEIDEAVAHIEVEDALLALNAAVDNLRTAIAAARNPDNARDSVGGAEGAGVLTELLAAAEHVRDGWDRVRNAITS